MLMAHGENTNVHLKWSVVKIKRMCMMVGILWNVSRNCWRPKDVMQSNWSCQLL